MVHGLTGKKKSKPRNTPNPGTIHTDSCFKDNSRFVNGRTCDKGNDDYGMSNLQAHSLGDVLILLGPKLCLGEDELGHREHVSFEHWCGWCRTRKIQHDTQCMLDGDVSQISQLQREWPQSISERKTHGCTRRSEQNRRSCMQRTSTFLHWGSDGAFVILVRSKLGKEMRIHFERLVKRHGKSRTHCRLPRGQHLQHLHESWGAVNKQTVMWILRVARRTWQSSAPQLTCHAEMLRCGERKIETR